MEGVLWPPANWAAAEPDVAGLGSEAMATLCVEQLQLLLQHYESNESSLCQTAAFQPDAREPQMKGSARSLPAILADMCTGPRRSAS